MDGFEFEDWIHYFRKLGAPFPFRSLIQELFQATFMHVFVLPLLLLEIAILDSLHKGM